MLKHILAAVMWILGMCAIAVVLPLNSLAFLSAFALTAVCYLAARLTISSVVSLDEDGEYALYVNNTSNPETFELDIYSVK